MFFGHLSTFEKSTQIKQKKIWEESIHRFTAKFKRKMLIFYQSVTFKSVLKRFFLCKDILMFEFFY
jgi:hypothetical protein